MSLYESPELKTIIDEFERHIMNQIYIKALLSLRTAVQQRAQTPEMAAKLAEIEAAIIEEMKKNAKQ